MEYGFSSLKCVIYAEGTVSVLVTWALKLVERKKKKL
jgi:hypothetical protein